MRFEVLLNGKRVCIAGLEGRLNIEVHSTWPEREALRRMAERAARPRETDPSVGEAALHVEGVERQHDKDIAIWDWVETRIKSGDLVVIRVLGPGKVTPPTRRTPTDSGPDKNAAAAYGVA